ncbi:MAG TPA: protein kinase, partial [Labilithrix sp.]
MIGQLVADRFEVERLVGSGGMGEVFRAKDRLTGGAVAIKVLHASAGRDLDRFKREAQILAEVTHPRIVKYVAHGVSGGVRPWLAMEWLEGEDLGQRLARQGLGLVDTLTVARRICEALAALHDKAIVHRDIKPSNIFLSAGKTDQVKLLDLGVARIMNASRPSTRSGVMVGTPGYMAPEQARGMLDIDARADVFSLGCVMFECLANRPAFQADNVAALLAKILLERPPSLREVEVDVPPALDDLVTRMMSKHTLTRPANGAAVLRELDQLGKLADIPAPRGASVPQQRALTGSERRLVSVVMASYGEGEVPIDEPGTQATLAASFDPRAVVASFGAEAEILADGSIVVTLMEKGGASDQAAHAARCALALRSHMIGAHVSLATGLGTISGKSAVGEVIERAATMLAASRSRERAQSGEETMAGSSPVFLDETTAGLLDMRFDVGGDDRGLFIRGLRERETKARTLLGKPTPFVGRDRELSTLVGIFDESIHEPVARAVLVTGVAGAGKSRMLAEFLRQAREKADVEPWLARGDVMSEGSPFSLLARLIRRAAGISGGEPLGARQQKLRARIGRNVGAEDVTRVSEFVGEIASVHFPDAQSLQLRAARQDSILMGDQMRRAFCDLVVAEAKAAPVLVVLEDLHWGDLPTVSFIDSALRAAADLPFMVLGAARSEVHEQFPRLWEQRSLQEIRLGPLTRRAAETLVRDVLGGDVANEDLAKLLDLAAGNVFFLEELIRAFAETTGRSTARTVGTVPPAPSSSAKTLEGEWSLPSTVLAMLEARLERLDPAARRVLRAASIFGEVFWRGGVLALTGGAQKATEVDEWLSELARREIVHRRDVSRFPSEHEYAFRHALVRDAAYQMLTAEDRTLGHRLAADWLEKAGEHEAMVLGEHFERGDARAKAITFYARAAEQALEGNDFAAAKLRAARAVEVGATGAERGRLELLASEASRWRGEHDLALSHARAALGALALASDGWYGALAEAFDAASALGDVASIREFTEALARAEAEASEMTAQRVAASCRIVLRLMLAGAFDRADALLARIEREAAALVATDPRTRAFVMAARVARAKWLGDTEDAAVLAREAAAAFEELGDVRNAALQSDIAGFAFLQLGAFAIAEPMLIEASAAAERIGLAGVAAEARLHLTQLYSRTGRRNDAVKSCEEVLPIFAT